MTYLLANGCSYTDPNYGAKGNNYWHSDEDKIKLGIPIDNWPMWPQYVADKLGIEHVNLAVSGGSNERMYRTSEEHILEKGPKPKVLMHLWTTGYRNEILGMQMNDHVFNIPLEIANHLYKRNEMMICDNAKRYSIANYAGAFDMIKFYYPEEYEGVKDFYTTLYNEVTHSQTHNAMHSMKSIFDFTNDLNRRYVDLPAQRFMCEYYRDTYRATGEKWLDYRMKLRMNNDLKPIYNTYRLCKKHDIQLITVGGLALGGFIGYYYEPRDLDVANPNYFEEALLGSLKMCKWMEANWLKNYWFNELERLVFDNKYVIHNWPLVRELLPPKQRHIEDWLPGYKNVSLLDNHPHWETQELIGDLFYDLYKKNYS